jgi:two-component sensor histidine kinase
MALHKARVETAIKSQRDWYFSVLRYMGAPMIVCDTDGRVRFANASAEQLLAIEPSPDSPRPLEQILEVRDRPGASSIVSVLESALSEEGSRSRALLLTGHGGVQLPVELTTTPIRSENGTVLGFVLFLKPQGSIDENSSQERGVRSNLQEYLQTELIRLLILQEQGGETTDRFVEGQLDAHRRLMQQIFGAGASAGEPDWRRTIVRRAVRDAHEQTRSILLGHADIARSGSVSQAKLARYIEVMVGRLRDSHGLAPPEVTATMEIAVPAVELDSAIYTVLIVNEVIEQALSTGVRGALAVTLTEDDPDRLGLTIRHRAQDPSRQPAATPVLDAILSEVQGRLSTEAGEDTVWRILYRHARAA